MSMTSPYRVYRTSTFANIWDEEEKFVSDWKSSGLYSSGLISDDNIKTMYYLLYARYGNSHIRSSDPKRFKYAVFSIIFSAGPSWAKRLDIQAKLRGLSEDDIRGGTKAIYNHARNPETEPTTGSLEELEYINEQNTQQFKKAKLEGYALLWELIDTDVTSEFLDKFKPLFIAIVLGDGPLYYEENDEEELSDDN